MPAAFLITFAVWIAALRIPMKILLLVVFGPEADGWNSRLIDIIPEALILALYSSRFIATFFSAKPARISDPSR